MRHILLIGFKNVGKSTIGRELARTMELPYRDLDRELEQVYEQTHHRSLTARQIMNEHGEQFFRQLEGTVLKQVLGAPEQTIISLGGGTILQSEHQPIIAQHIVIHVTAPKSQVYERIMVNGRPAFFAPDENPYDAFERMWEQRRTIYERLATFTIANNSSVGDVTEKLALCLRAGMI